tara:strand:+ start:583 stop:1986 length:1404 start_codon:yes stop_codon:yes gene_type:complete
MSDIKKLIVENPFTENKVADIVLKNKFEISTILETAYNAKYELTSIERSRILDKAADIYNKNIYDEALLITKEAGICIKQAIYEVERSINALKYASFHAKKLDDIDFSTEYIMEDDNPNVDLEVIVEPYDLAIAITPFNHPLNQLIHKIAPAIAAGTSIVLKPSEKTPLCAYRLREILTESGLPEDVFMVLNGYDVVDTVKQLVTYEKLDIVSFTGSVRVGKSIEKIMNENGNTLKKYIPELGGNAALYVADDADLDIASTIALAAFDNAGQRCTAIKRIFLDNQIADKFIEKFIAKTQNIKYGNPFNDDNDMGTVIDVDAANNILERVNKAISSGAKLLYGNKVHNALYSPTVLDNVTSDMELVKKETFGPIAPIIRVDSIDDCVEIVKSTSFRLAGAIATKSLDKAKEYSSRICVGQFSWNGPPGYRTENAPFGGFGCSGNGEKEGIVHSIKGLMKIRTFWNHNK